MAVRNPLVTPVHGHSLSGSLTESGAGALAEAETRLGHRFSRPELLLEALTHRSAVTGRRVGRGRLAPSTGAGSNERLEFVGDRVLGLLIAEWLIERYPGEQEGGLGTRLAHLVSQPVIADIAADLGLPAMLRVAEGESRAGVRQRATVLADATEALIGALYLDAGLAPARAFVRRVWIGAIETHEQPPKDPKTLLQEFLLARGRPLPVYALTAREGPPHDPVFTVRVGAGEVVATGTAGSKRAAEREAAASLLRMLSTSGSAPA